MKNILTILKYLPALTQLITTVESAFGPKNGANKKKAVIDAFTAIIEVAAPFVEAANPAYGALIGDTVDFLVKQLNAYAGLSDQPPAPPADPYFTTVFHSVDEAKAAGKAGDRIYVLPDKTFRLVYGGAGSPIDPTWTLVTTIEG